MCNKFIYSFGKFEQLVVNKPYRNRFQWNYSNEVQSSATCRTLLFGGNRIYKERDLQIEGATIQNAPCCMIEVFTRLNNSSKLSENVSAK